MHHTSHIAVIGAGPAGAAAAITLARAHVAVTLIEARKFPRNKVCGEFISPAATSLLADLVPMPILRQAGAADIDRFILQVGRRSFPAPLRHPGLSISRASLDSLLLDEARKAGVAIRQPARAVRVEQAAGGIRVLLAEGDSLEAHAAIIADGAGRVGDAEPTHAAPDLVGFKCHLAHAPADAPPGAVIIRAGRAGYLGLMAIEHGRAVCALVAARDLVHRCEGDGDAIAAALWPAFSPRHREAPWLACPVHRAWPHVRAGTRMLRVGNAAAAVDPVAGEGIGLALWSGWRAAVRLVQAAGNDAPTNSIDFVDHAAAALQRDLRRRMLTRLPACWLAASVLMRPWACRAAGPVLAVPGALLRPWLALSGK